MYNQKLSLLKARTLLFVTTNIEL